MPTLKPHHNIIATTIKRSIALRDKNVVDARAVTAFAGVDDVGCLDAAAC